MQSPHWVLTVIIGRLQDDLAELDAAIGRGEPDIADRLERVCAGNVRDLQFMAGYHEAVRERTEDLEQFTEAVRAGPGARMRQVRIDRPLLQELETKLVDRDLRIEELEKALASANIALEEAKPPAPVPDEVERIDRTPEGYGPIVLTDDAQAREVKGEAAANTASELDRALDLLDAVSRGDAPAGDALEQLRQATDALEQSHPTVIVSDAELMRAIDGRPRPIRVLDGGEVFDAEGRVLGRVGHLDVQWAREALDAARPARPTTLVPTDDEDDERTVELLPATKPAPLEHPPLVPDLSPIGQCLHGVNTDARCARPVRSPGARFCAEHVPLPPEF